MPEWYVSYAWGDDKTPEGTGAGADRGRSLRRRGGERPQHPARQGGSGARRQHLPLHATDRRRRSGLRDPERQVSPLTALHVRTQRDLAHQQAGQKRSFFKGFASTRFRTRRYGTRSTGPTGRSIGKRSMMSLIAARRQHGAAILGEPGIAGSFRCSASTHRFPTSSGPSPTSSNPAALNNLRDDTAFVTSRTDKAADQGLSYRHRSRGTYGARWNDDENPLNLVLYSYTASKRELRQQPKSVMGQSKIIQSLIAYNSLAL